MSRSVAETKSDQAKHEYQNGKYIDALHYWEQAVQEASDTDPIHTYYSNKCACNQKLEKYKDALDDANSAVSYKPTWPKGYQRKGACLERLKRYPEALAAYERADELSPNDPEIGKSLSRLRSYVGGGSSGFGSSSSGFNFNDFTNQPWANQIKTLLVQYISQATTWWSTCSDSQKYTVGAAAVFVLYYLYSSLFGRSGYDYYYDDYGYGSGGSGWLFTPYGGLTWTAWGSIMLAAWKLPPMFPNELGQYASPFFGMNMTTFMWLLRMLTSQGGGYGRGFGGYGGRRGRGMF